MYTDEDLSEAVDIGIFNAESVEKFRHHMSAAPRPVIADEENIRLIGGFNDIFIVITCGLLLFSSLWVIRGITGSETIGLAVFSIFSWGLAEYFVRLRRMALPAIVLLVTFIGGSFLLQKSLFVSQEGVALISACGVSAIAAYIHWLRFKVPITIAVGAIAVAGVVFSTAMGFIPQGSSLLLVVLWCCGIATFIFAMFWDSSDTKRITRRSDVAFWLHLVSAPLIIHPVFASLGIFGGNGSLLNILGILCLYLLTIFISVVIDRRAFMVSSLMYVIYALTILFKNFGGLGYEVAITGVVIGAALLLLSAYWHQVRGVLVTRLPHKLTILVPNVN